jgi:glycerol kinase
MNEINTPAGSVTSTSGVYVVTVFSGLLAPYWDPAATGLLVRLDVIHDNPNRALLPPRESG